MANPNPDALKARMGKKRKRKPGTIHDVLGIVWVALAAAQDALSSELTTDRLKGCHAVFQGAQAYAKLLEIGELEARLKALEDATPHTSKPSGVDHALN
jgi:hypothetical protein